MQRTLESWELQHWGGFIRWVVQFWWTCIECSLW
jgi:hypothetical protein